MIYIFIYIICIHIGRWHNKRLSWRERSKTRTQHSLPLCGEEGKRVWGERVWEKRAAGWARWWVAHTHPPPLPHTHVRTRHTAHTPVEFQFQCIECVCVCVYVCVCLCVCVCVCVCVCAYI